MPVEITPADRDRIVRDLAAAGKPAPSWVAADPKLKAVYDRALPTPAGTVPPKHAAGTPAATKGAAATPAGRGQGSQGRGAALARKSRGAGSAATRTPRRTGSGRAGTSSPRPAGPVPLPRALTRAAGGSRAGGLMLAIFLYPIALVIFQHGPAGFGMWLRAKFLNQVPTGAAAHLGTDGQPLGKIQGPIVPKTPPSSYTPPVNQPGTGGQTTTPVAPDSWQRMMAGRQRIPA